MRLQSIRLAYDFEDLRKKWNLSKLQLYVNAQNVFVWTKYSGYDPEVNEYSGEPWAANISTTSTYPKPTSFILGLNLGF